MAAAAIFAAALLAGCDGIELPSKARPEDQAREALASGDLPRAIRGFEAALDGTAKTADLHLQLGLIYDDHLDDPIDALHHYRRYLALSEDDTAKKREVQEFVDRIELVLATRAADSGLLTKREGARLSNENLELRKQVTDLRAELAAERKKPKASPTPSGTPAARAASSAPASAGGKTYTVQAGDTLATVSRKFYNTPQRWKEIADANEDTLGGSINLRVGQVLTIP